MPTRRSEPLIQLARIARADNAWARAGCRLAEQVLGIHQLNALYAGLPPRAQPQELFRHAIASMRITLAYDPAALAHIPRTGPCVFVANHPFGMLEGIVMGALLSPLRTDFKFLGNFLLDAIPEMRPFNIPVDPFGGSSARSRNIAGMRAAVRWLGSGGTLVLFPAGEVASLNLSQRRVTDPLWQPNLARLLRRTNTPIVPIHFAGGNSALFHLLGLVHPRLRTLRLPAEFLAKRGAALRINIGEPVSPGWLNAAATDAELMQDLRMRTYALAGRRASAPARPASKPLPALRESSASSSLTPATLRTTAHMPPVAPAEPQLLLTNEIASLPPDCLLCESREFLVYSAAAAQIPHMLHEIGRQREIAFRHVGEGTGKPLDLDRFDRDYDHLFVWNRDKDELVGAYRIGAADEIVRRRGVDGLYTSTLFAYDSALLDRLGPMLELGRSFVRAEYQRTFGALHLLWRGIGQYVTRRPHYRNLMGAVSISDAYSTMSQRLMTWFLQENHLSEELSRCVSPRNPIEFAAAPVGGPEEDLARITDMGALSARVRDLERGQRDVPILIKRYLALGGQLLGVNRDPQFGNVVDGLIVIDLLAAPRRVVERYLGAGGLRALEAHDAQSRAHVAP